MALFAEHCKIFSVELTYQFGVSESFFLCKKLIFN